MTGKNRNLEHKILKLLEMFPVVAIIGPRQCGKTFLSKKIRPKWKYVDLEDPQTFEQVSSDPKFFLTKNPKDVIIDEAQILPSVFNTLRGVIDENRKENGRYIITGSSSPELLKNISETLAGRIAIIELETFKFNEFAEKPLSPFYSIFQGEPIDKILSCDYKVDSKEILDFWFYGGYPDVCLSQNSIEKEIWFDNYIRNYINRDVKRLFPGLHTNKFQRFLLMLFKLSGTIVNKRELAQLIEVSEPTIKDYIDIAHGTFIWRNLTSFEHNIKKEVSKMPKGHFRDSGILHHALKLSTLDELDEHPIVGHSFESFVIEEIIKGVEATNATSWSYHYYRTRNRAEVDLILHGKFGIIPIEIKYGMKTPLKSLTSLRNFVKENNLPFGILVNNSNAIEWLTPEVLQVPVGFL